MILTSIEPELRRIIEALRSGNPEDARSRTVELIESVLRMSSPMYREPVSSRNPLPNYAPGSLRILAQDLRDVSFTIRRGLPADALPRAEQALAAFLNPKDLATV